MFLLQLFGLQRDSCIDVSFSKKISFIYLFTNKQILVDKRSFDERKMFVKWSSHFRLRDSLFWQWDSFWMFYSVTSCLRKLDSAKNLQLQYFASKSWDARLATIGLLSIFYCFWQIQVSRSECVTLYYIN